MSFCSAPISVIPPYVGNRHSSTASGYSNQHLKPCAKVFLQAQAHENLMQRRHFITLLGSAAGWPVAIRAQQKPLPVIGMLGTGWPGTVIAPLYAAVGEGLLRAGSVGAQSVTVAYR